MVRRMARPPERAVLNPFDRELLFFLNGLAGQFELLDAIMRITVGDQLVAVLGVVTLVGIWFAGKTPAERERMQVTLFVGASSVGLANLAVHVINFIWARPRPFAAMPDSVNLLFYPSTDPSFPANPVAVAFAIAGAVWLVNRPLGLTLGALASLQAVARVFVGVAYPTDVIGGAAIGLLVLACALGLRRLIRPIPEITIRAARALLLA